MPAQQTQSYRERYNRRLKRELTRILDDKGIPAGPKRQRLYQEALRDAKHRSRGKR